LGKSFKSNDEGMVDLGVNEVLVVNVVDLLSLDYFSLIQQLQRHELPCLLVLGHLHLSEPTLP